MESILITEYNEQKEFAKERQEGVRQGSSEKAIRTAMTMIENGEPNSKIELYTDLPESTIESLRNSVGRKKPLMA